MLNCSSKPNGTSYNNISLNVLILIAIVANFLLFEFEESPSTSPFLSFTVLASTSTSASTSTYILRSSSSSSPSSLSSLSNHRKMNSILLQKLPKRNHRIPRGSSVTMCTTSSSLLSAVGQSLFTSRNNIRSTITLNSSSSAFIVSKSNLNNSRKGNRASTMFTNISDMYTRSSSSSSSKTTGPTALFASSKKEIFHHGDKVQFIDSDGTNCQGSISERKGGWYTVQVIQQDGTNNDSREVKRRASQLKKVFSLSQTPVKVEKELTTTSTTTMAVVETTSTDTSSTLPNQSLEQKRMKNTIQDEEIIQNIPELPTIINLDAAIMNQISSSSSISNMDQITNQKDIQYIQQCIEFTKYKKWVMFTDLHCSPTTLDTCIHVLDTVHKVAKEHDDTGVLFLGDFWHHRGSVRVDCLNAILNALSDWEVPMIMIPGNHDQVTLSGLEHALTPLQNAYRIPTKSSSLLSSSPSDTTIPTPTSTIPGILIFSHPTKFYNAMFVPHIRDIGSMQSVLQSKASSSSSAVFVHADVTGAYMNDLIISSHGVSPRYFPPNVPIYSGHFHKPHFVNQPIGAPGVNIRYVGSPYETTLSEAGQNKALLILDATDNWNCIEEIPLDIGRKHWRATSIDAFLNLQIMDEAHMNDSITGPLKLISPGDRVVVSVDQMDLEIHREEAADVGLTSDFDAKVKALRSFGATVEIRETKSIPSFLMGSDGGELGSNSLDLDWLLVEDLLPKTTWSNFVQNEVNREMMTNNTATKVTEIGNKILDELDDGSSELKDSDESILNARKNAMLDFEEISIEGFGPFKEQVTYPLKERGLVLVKGSNHDIGSDSNGTGKSSLVMSALWALTGSIDPRPAQDDKVSDIINDTSKAAKVTIRGTIDNTPFIIARSKTSSRGALTFFLGDEDLTRQSVKETQLVIDEKLGAGSHVLSRTIFHGQHAINGLLEATDTKLKDELSLIVSLKIWQDGASLARKKGRALSKKVSELDGMLKIREKDLQAIERKFTSAQENVESKQQELKSREEELLRIRASLQIEVDDEIIDLDSKRRQLDEADSKVKNIEEILNSLKFRHQKEINPIQEDMNSIDEKLQDTLNSMRNKEREQDRHEAKLTSEREMFEVTKAKWGIGDLNDIENYKPPEVCPTCKQPTSDDASHTNMKQELESAFNSSKEKIESSSQSLESVKLQLKKISDHVKVLNEHRDQAEMKLIEMEKAWQTTSSKTLGDLEEAKTSYSKLSHDFSLDLQKLEAQNRLRQMENRAEGDFRMCQNNIDLIKQVQDSTKSELDEMTRSMESLKGNREAQKEELSILSAASNCFGARGIQTFVLQNTILALQLVSQSYLDELSDGTLRLQLQLDEGERITRTVTVLGSDGTWLERPLASLSGGQWRRCSLALSLGFSDLIARRGRLCSSLIVFDEPLTHLDSNGRDNVGKLLRKVIQNQPDHESIGSGGLSVSTIIMILQDLVAEELSESFDRIDEVVRSKGKSTVVVDE